MSDSSDQHDTGSAFDLISDDSRLYSDAELAHMRADNIISELRKHYHSIQVYRDRARYHGDEINDRTLALLEGEVRKIISDLC